MKRLVDYDPINGITTYCDYNSVTDVTTVISEYDDVSANLELNKALANDPEYWAKGVKAGLAHYAHIPNSIVTKWLIEDGVNVLDRNDERKVYRLLNSPEYKYLKTTTKMHWGKR